MPCIKLGCKNPNNQLILHSCLQKFMNIFWICNDCSIGPIGQNSRLMSSLELSLFCKQKKCLTSKSSCQYPVQLYYSQTLCRTKCERYFSLTSHHPLPRAKPPTPPPPLFPFFLFFICAKKVVLYYQQVQIKKINLQDRKQ